MFQWLFGTLRAAVRHYRRRFCCGFAEGLLKGGRSAWPGGAVAAVARQAGEWSWLEHRFEVDSDADLGGDQQRTAVEGHVPRQAPALPVEGAVGGEDGPLPAPGSATFRSSGVA